MIGCTYVVTSCNCSKDPLLKEPSDWCEYCLCRKCGGKYLPAYFDRYTTNNAVKTDVDAFWEVSLLDLAFVVAVAVAAIGSVTYAGDRLHRNLYMLGLVAAAFLLKQFLSSGNGGSWIKYFTG